MAFATTADEPKRRRSAADYANSAVSTAQNVKKLAKVAQAVQAVTSFIAATWEVWLIVIVIVIIVALFLVIITTILGQNSNSNQAILPTLTPTPTQGQVLTCDSGDYVQCLREQLNIIVIGGNVSNAKKIFNAFSFPAQSEKYLSLLTRGGKTLRIVIVGNNPRGCNGLAIGFAGTIVLTDGACFSINPTNFRYLMIHESGHIIGARNRHLYASFPWKDLQKEDAACYDQGYLKSYALRCGSSCGINPKDESFAEAIAIALTKNSTNKAGFLSSQAIIDFKNTCPNTYAWINSNIYGGFSFY